MGGTRSLMKRDTAGNAVQGFCPDPTKGMAPINMTTAGSVSLADTRVFSVGVPQTGDYDITGWLAITICPAAVNLNYYLNGNTTNTMLLPAGEPTTILIHERTTSLAITGTDTAVQIQGM